MVSTTLWGLRMLSTAYVDLLIVFEDLPKERNMERKTHPLLWIPSSYIVMGVIYTMVVTVGAIMYRNMGLSVKEAAFITSSLGIPYTIKPLWASFLEMFKTKKFFVVLRSGWTTSSCGHPPVYGSSVLRAPLRISRPTGSGSPV